ncbi:MAG: response regulator transcription factor [Candidatus Kapabacteria bacterium]|nr:response regulator transcription factor [Candidatus Kapabacteria bacterium]
MKKRKPISVAVIEDDAVIREALVQAIDADGRFACKLDVPTAEELFARPRLNSIDVFLIDLILPGMTGIEAITRLRRRKIHGKMLVLTMYDDDDRIRQAIMAGARGYLLKTTPLPELMEAIQKVDGGDTPLADRAMRALVDLVADMPHPSRLRLLTQREYDVLKGLSDRKLYKEISIQLGIGIDTVRTHVKAVYQKLKVHKRSEAAQLFRSSNDAHE